MGNRPALKILIPFVLGIISGYALNIPVNSMLLVFAVITISSIVLPRVMNKKHSWFFEIFVIGGLFIAGTLRYELANDYLSPFDISTFTGIGKSIALQGTIVRDPDVRPNRVNLTVAVDSLFAGEIPSSMLRSEETGNDNNEIVRLESALPTTGKVLVALRNMPSEFVYGDRINIRGLLEAPKGQRNPGELNYRKYLAAQGIRACMSINHERDIQLVNRGNGSWLLGRVIYPLRVFITSGIDRTIGGQEGALLKGLLVGARGEIDHELRDAFAKVGVIHVLAVSGLHVGFIVLFAILLFKLFRFPRTWRVILTVAVLVIYIYLTNQKAPVIRASVMAAVLLIGNALERKTEVFNSLSLAALIVLVINPLDLFETGFQLSFTAVASIVLLYNRLRYTFGKSLIQFRERGKQIKVYLISLFFVSLAAQLGTLPLTALYFNRIPVVSLLANLIVVPLVALIVILGYITTLCNVFWQGLAQVYANANWFFLNILIHIVKWGADIPFAYLERSTPGLVFVLSYYCGLGLIFFWGQRRVRGRLIIVSLILFNFIIWAEALSPRPGITATFFDVGQGDAALIEFPNGKTMLVDAGPVEEEYNSAERVIAPYLMREGIKKIDVLLLTHSHADHIGGGPYLLCNLRIGRIVDSMAMTDSEIYQEILYLADSLGVPLRKVRTGDTLNIHSAISVSILHPNEDFVRQAEKDPTKVNDVSIVARLSFGRRAFLLTGDAEKQSEKYMLSLGVPLQSDVLKVGHHGSTTSSTPSFIKAVKPAYAVIPVGKYNRFNLPSDLILRRLELYGAEVIRTDKNGAAVFWTDGNKLVRKR